MGKRGEMDLRDRFYRPKSEYERVKQGLLRQDDLDRELHSSFRDDPGRTSHSGAVKKEKYLWKSRIPPYRRGKEKEWERVIEEREG